MREGCCAAVVAVDPYTDALVFDDDERRDVLDAEPCDKVGPRVHIHLDELERLVVAVSLQHLSEVTGEAAAGATAAGYERDQERPGRGRCGVGCERNQLAHFGLALATR